MRSALCGYFSPYPVLTLTGARRAGGSVGEGAGEEYLAAAVGECGVAKVRDGVDALELCGLEQGIEGRGDLGSAP
jgi:hypothetical protein